MSDRLTVENLLGNTLHIDCIYPDNNPSNYIQDISDALYYVGVFDGIVEKKSLASQDSCNE